jgi:hypothetical protein
VAKREINLKWDKRSVIFPCLEAAVQSEHKVTEPFYSTSQRTSCTKCVLYTEGGVTVGTGGVERGKRNVTRADGTCSERTALAADSRLSQATSEGSQNDSAQNDVLSRS